jgi:RHS repeat-associated protein
MSNRTEFCDEAGAPRCVAARNAASSRFPFFAKRLAGLLGLLVLLGASTPARAGGAGLDAGDCPPEGQADCGDPINAATGNAFEKVLDYTSAGPNPVTVTRYYNSAVATPTGAFGNWTCNYDRKISVSSSEVDVIRPDGKDIAFFPNGSGGWEGITDLDLRLTQTSSTTWTLTDQNDNIETYSSVGGYTLFTSIKVRNGYTQTMQYNGTQVSSVVDTYGRTLNISYNSSGLISSIATPDGLVLNYSYSTGGYPILLTQVAYPTSPATSQTYLYEDTHFVDVSSKPLTGIIDENGNRFTTWSYDDSYIYPVAISSQHAGGADLTTLAYAAPGNVATTTVTNALGLQELFKFKDMQVGAYAQNGQYYPVSSEIDRMAAPGVAAAVSKTTYDSNGYIASRTDWNGNVTTYVNDAHGNVTSRTVGFGTGLAETTTAAWLSTFHLPTTITQPLRTVSFTYDANGNPLTKTIAASTGTSVWHYTYNATGEVLTATDPRGNVTSYAYDVHGNLTSRTNALGRVTSITSYDANGRPLSITDPNGLVTTLTYNFRGQLTSKTKGTWMTSYAYDAVGELTKFTRPDGSYLAFAYDAAHRLIGVTDALGRRIVYTLDAAGDVVEAQTFGAANNVRQTHSYAYDALKRLIQSIGAQGETTRFGYDADSNRLQIVDPLADATANAYDALNRLTLTTDPNGGVAAFGYDTQNRLTSVIDPRRLATSYSYNELDEPTAIDSPDSGDATRNYDAAGNVVTATDARGKTTTYSYDALNRLTGAAYADGSSTAYAYDQGADGIGRLSSMSDTTGTTAWSYEIHGLVTGKTQKNGGATLTTSWAYDTFGRLASMTYPSGAISTYAYDANGQATAINYKAAGSAVTNLLLAQIGWQPFGPVDSWVMGNGASYVRTFDLDGRIAALALPGNHNIALAYDPASRITSIVETGLAAKSFGHDKLNRLTRYTYGPNSEAATYDADGNRVLVGASHGFAPVAYSQHYVDDPKSNRLLAIASSVPESVAGSVPETFAFDASGNTVVGAIGGSRFVYAYDAKNRLASATNGPLSLAYGVNGLGQRVSVANTSTSSERAVQVSFAYEPPQTYFLYDGAGHLIGQYDGSGIAQQETVWLGDLPVATLQAGTAYYIAPDHLGAPHQITDASQNVVWFWDHDPFGNGAPTGTLTYALRLPGQFYDPLTGLNYNGFRDYDPATGRYIESDPIGVWGGINTYAYVGGNPVVRFDYRGLQVVGQSNVDGQGSYQSNATGQGSYQSYANGEDAAQPYNPGILPSQLIPAPLTQFEIDQNALNPNGPQYVPGFNVMTEPCYTGGGDTTSSQNDDASQPEKMTLDSNDLDAQTQKLQQTAPYNNTQGQGQGTGTGTSTGGQGSNTSGYDIPGLPH